MTRRFKYLLLIWLVFSEFLFTVYVTSGDIRTDPEKNEECISFGQSPVKL